MSLKPSTELNQTKDAIAFAQEDMRNAYGNGAIGALVSGTIWVVASAIGNYSSAMYGMWALFFGGMLIQPLSMAMLKLLGFRGNHDKSNPLGKLALEGTVFMLLCIPLAFLLAKQDENLFFLAMMLIIGGRYLTFNSIYGLKTYWLFGGVLALTAFLLFYIGIGPASVAMTGGIIEILFGSYLYYSISKNHY